MNTHYILVTIPPAKKDKNASTYWIIPRQIKDKDLALVALSELNYNFQDAKTIETYFSKKHHPPASNVEILTKPPSRAYLRNRWTIRPGELESKLNR